ncbi:hypothetical protein SAMN06265360_10650 [Haloechinothrix alba]|uniref:Uncharacterized protein n=1 Tax=Haloechinothrix alba TaxID=664784 RepID=A0A238WDU9_9PSEU|nr:hypothetical protein [Haloechinothrix alba]SNR44444.1 hypothetical protein SAMN06265360_10650 [Haloechinothrix alba]
MTTPSQRETIARAVESCSTCGASVVWAITHNDKPMPVNVLPSRRGNVSLAWDGKALRATVLGRNQAAGAREYGLELYTSHFTDCPQATQHRRRR